MRFLRGSLLTGLHGLLRSDEYLRENGIISGEEPLPTLESIL